MNTLGGNKNVERSSIYKKFVSNFSKHQMLQWGYIKQENLEIISRPMSNRKRVSAKNGPLGHISRVDIPCTPKFLDFLKKSIAMIISPKDFQYWGI